MPGHYKKNKGTVRIPVIPYDPSTEANSPPPLPPIKHNPFEGQTVTRGGKKVKRTPSTRPHKD